MNKKKQDLRPVDEPLFSYWQALYLAFFSRRLYVDVAKRWRGYGVLYLLLVIAIACIPISARIIYNFNQYFDDQMIAPLKALPVLQIQNGNVVFDKPMPYLVKNKTGHIVAMIDTTGRITGMSDLYPDLTILITKDSIFLRPPKFQLFFNSQQDLKGVNVYAQSLNKETNEIFVGENWVKSSGISRVKWLAEMLVYPLMTGFAFGIDSVIMLFLAFIGQLLSIIVFKHKMSLKDTCRLFMVAATAQIAVFFVFLTANIIPPGGGFGYLVLVSVYFSFAVLSVRRESRRMVFV